MFQDLMRSQFNLPQSGQRKYDPSLYYINNTGRDRQGYIVSFITRNLGCILKIKICIYVFQLGFNFWGGKVNDICISEL